MKKGIDRNEVLFLMFQKCIILKTIGKGTKPLLDFDLILSDMGEYMSCDELNLLAMKYLQLGNPKQTNIGIIADRIYMNDSTLVSHK